MSDLLSLCEHAVKLALKHGAEEAEAYGVDGHQSEVFLERNDVKLGKSQVRSGIGVRVLKGKGLGFASTNLLEAGRVAEIAERAVTMASKAPPDAYNALPEPRPLRKIPGLYDRGSEAVTAEDVLRHATSMLRAAKDYDPRVTVDSGTFEASVGERALSSSRGVQATERRSDFSYFMIAFAREGSDVGSFDYLFEGTHEVKGIRAEELGRRLAERVMNALGARKSRTFQGTVILNPYTVESLIAGFLTSALNSNNAQKGMSLLAGKKGETIASRVLTVRDDGRIPGGLGSSSFDREGIPHAPTTLIDQGILMEFLYNTYTASKEDRSTSGHASGDQRNVPAIGPTNFIIDPGTGAKDALIEEVQKGLLVTRFSGWPQPVSGDFSGVVKGGYLIEGGEVVHPVKETLIAGNVFDLLEGLSGVSKEVEEVMGYRLPYLRFEDVSITSE